jgi:cysteine-rich repeat protein
MTGVQLASRRWVALALWALPACHPNDFIVVKLETATGLPAIAQLTLQASDGASQSTATEPATPNLAGIAFPETYVIATPQGGPVNILVSGLDANGNVFARGATTAVASGSVQAVVVTLSATCSSSLDCDPAGVCSGSVTCGDAGSCVPSNSIVAPNGTGCGQDGGLCESGGCIQPSCGDGIVEPGEQCDLGALNSNSGQCTKACQVATCGDGYVNQDPLPDGGYIQELCDWGFDGGILTDGGNSNTLPNHCRENCLPARCGDGVVDTGERCDLGANGPDGGGGNGAGVGCNATCMLFGEVTTVTGSNCSESCYQDGPLGSALFNAPRGITILGSTLYVADEFNDLIRAIDLDAGLVSTVSGRAGIEQSIDGDAGIACFDSPHDLTVFQGELFVAEPTEVRVVTLDGTVTTLTGQGGIGFSDGPFQDAGFVNIEAITHDGPNLYVTDVPLGIRLLDIAAQEVITLYPDGGQETATSSLSGICAVDGGLLYVADSKNDDLQSVDPTDAFFQYIAGDPGGAGFVDGLGLAARFSEPAGICTDGVSIYVADQLNGSVRQVVPATQRVTTLAGNGQSANTPQDGTGRAATFEEPAACVWDPLTGDIFVTDVAANTIRRIH